MRVSTVSRDNDIEFLSVRHVVILCPNVLSAPLNPRTHHGAIEIGFIISLLLLLICLNESTYRQTFYIHLYFTTTGRNKKNMKRKQK